MNINQTKNEIETREEKHKIKRKSKKEYLKIKAPRLDF